MRIVTRKIFLALPAGTLFSKYHPCVFEDLRIKGDNAGDNDFRDQNIADAILASSSEDFFDVLFEAEKSGASMAMDFQAQIRDGCYDDDQLFAIWENADVVALIERLQFALRQVGAPSFPQR